MHLASATNGNTPL